MFLTSTDFYIAPYLIPTQAENTNGINAYIKDTEERMLKKLLGSVFYDALKAGIEALPAEWSATVAYANLSQVVYGSNIYQANALTIEGEIPGISGKWDLQPVNKWLKLSKGNKYDNEGRENNWDGFVDGLKPYVHSMYLKEYDSTVAPLGVVKAKSQNSEIVSPNQIIVRHYNRFVEKMGSYDGIGLYHRDIALTGHFGTLGLYHEDSLYGYLYSNHASFNAEVQSKGYADFRSYLNTKFYFPEYINSFGL